MPAVRDTMRDSRPWRQLWAMVVCASTHPGEPDLTGKWFTDNLEWGLEFRGTQVFEWEHGKIDNQSSFALSSWGDVFRLVVGEEGEEPVTFRMQLLDKNRLLLTVREEQVELKRQ